MTGLLPSLAAIGGILLLAAATGWLAARAILPVGGAFAPERLAWGFALGLLLLAAFGPVCFSFRVRPGWIAFLLLCGVVAAGSRFAPSVPAASPLLPVERRDEGGTLVRLLLLLLLVIGLLLYALRSLTEPMWATDFLAIWGWKAKTIFGAGGLPSWTWRTPELSFTHPEYPLGLPLLYSGIAFLQRRWDDHALALLFPLLQAATLLLLWGFLRRRGAPAPIPLAAAAALSLLEPLYRAFTTGMAEVPISFFLLLLGTALADSLEEESGARRRLVVAALGAAALKNEGLFAAAAAAVLAMAAPRLRWRTRLGVASAAFLPALAVAAAHLLWRGPLPLRDFQFSLLASSEFLARLLLGFRTILAEAILPGAPGLLAFGLLLVVGRRSPAGDRLLLLAAILLAGYALLPALCVWGPDWLARTAFARTAAALAPLAAAGGALRLSALFRRSEVVNR
jgi:hypothetical protein